MPKDTIIEHLAFASSLAIISRGIPQTMMEFAMKNFLDEIRCKLVLYLYRVERGISLYTTCLLSCFQAITISPQSTRWMKLKHRATKSIGPSCSLSWLVHLLLNVMITMRVTAPNRSRNVTERLDFGYWLGFVSGTMATPLYVLMLCLTDDLCLGLMVSASGSMVSIPYRLKSQVQHIHKCPPLP
jgi:vomeronasal1 receptor